MNFTVYPRLLPTGDLRTNPYVSDFVAALEAAGHSVQNAPHKNPLVSIFVKPVKSDVYVFHWPENVPDYKHGLIQTLMAFLLILRIRLAGKRLVWFLHNKQPHDNAGHTRLKRWLMKSFARWSSVVVTHASEGLDVLRQLSPGAERHGVFLHHPTKNRLTPAAIAAYEERGDADRGADLLIWGAISPYKGVPQFLKYAAEKAPELHIRVVGRCSTEALYEEVKRVAGPHVAIENKAVPFDELRDEIRRARYVLVPYAAESVLSSGILMDSLSFGARVIGPAVGSFADYAAEPQLSVQTFRTFADIPHLVKQPLPEVALTNYAAFLEAHTWTKFAERLVALVRRY